MKRSIFLLAGILVVTGCGKKETEVATDAPEAVAEDKGVILAVADDQMPEGSVMVEDFTAAMTDGKITVVMPQQTMEGKVSMEEIKKTKVESLGDGKLRYTVMTDKETERNSMAGQEQPTKETVNPLEGKALIATKGEDGTYSVELESGETTAEMEKEIDKIAKDLSEDTDLKMYGTEPRKVGDEWEASAADMPGLEGAEGTIKLKLEGIEEFNGVRCAKITGSLDLEGVPEGDDTPEGMKIRMTGDFVVFRSLEHRVDLENVLTGKMEMSGEMEPQPGMKMSMKMQAPMKMTGKATVTDAE